MGKVKYRIVGVYVSGDIERKTEKLRKWMDEKEEGVITIIGGILTQVQGTGGENRGGGRSRLGRRGNAIKGWDGE